jgi:site-specific recombinase XerD
VARRVSGAKDKVDGAVASGGVSSLIPSWERSLRARNRAAKTIRSYGDTARLVEDFLLRQGLPTVVADARPEHVESFIEAQLQEFRPATAAVPYRSLQQFFKWTVEEEEISASPMAKMSPPHVPEEPVPVVGDDELRRLLKACEGTKFEDRRDAAILRTFIDTGCRLGEVAGLRSSTWISTSTSSSSSGRACGRGPCLAVRRLGKPWTATCECAHDTLPQAHRRCGWERRGR